MSIRIVPIPRALPRPRGTPWSNLRAQFRQHWGLTCVTVFGGALLAFGRAGNDAKAETPAEGPPAVVAPTAVVQEKSPEMLRICGRVAAHVDVEVRCRNGGQVAKVLVKPGAVVKAGDTLAELDPAEEARALKRAELALAMSQTRLAQARQGVSIAEKALSCNRIRTQATMKAADARSKRARIRADRLKETLEMNFTSQEEYDSRETEATEAAANLDLACVAAEDLKTQELALELRRQDVSCAETQVELDKMALAVAQQRLSDTRVIAPAAGTITECNAQPGQFVLGGAGSSKLFTVSDLSRLYVIAMLDESHLSRVKAGQKVALASEAVSSGTLEGRVEHISPRGCRTGDKVCFEVRVEIIGGERERLRPEMNCCVLVER
ncbi:MAG TPA: efflux RND transporter periplasmic adaptor subunit [Planctomycetota bacterium]|nr:efflux RND transporter periplasmic adaptor subunit [Planctomycetota bacterium]